MSDYQSIVDRTEIEVLRVEFTDAAMMHDYDCRASLYTEDGVYRISLGNIEITGREAIRAWGKRAQEEEWDFFIQTIHPVTCGPPLRALVACAVRTENSKTRVTRDTFLVSLSGNTVGEGRVVSRACCSPARSAPVDGAWVRTGRAVGPACQERILNDAPS